MRNLQELDSLGEEILLTSRLDHGRDAPQRETVDLLAVAAEEAAGTPATLTGEPVELLGEPRLLHRLVRNLLENAHRHGLPPVAVEVRKDGATALLIVRDQGVVPQDGRERLFEPFFRGRAPEGDGGWGLGLALVRQIAERHGGKARCESGPGKGTAFIVELPVNLSLGKPA